MSASDSASDASFSSGEEMPFFDEAPITVIPLALKASDEPEVIELDEGDVIEIHNVALHSEDAKAKHTARLFASTEASGKLLVCTLRSGHTEQYSPSLTFHGPETVQLKVEGDGEMHLFLTASFNDEEIDFEGDDEEMAEEAESDEESEVEGEEIDPAEMKKLEAEIKKKMQEREKANKNKRAQAEEVDSEESEEEKPKPAKQAKKDEPKKEQPKKEQQPKKEESSKKEQKEQPKKDEGKKEAKPMKKMLKGGVGLTVLEDGVGKTAENGSKVRVEYTGKLPNGKMFDSSKGGKPFEFVVGKGNVIKGWDIGFNGMKEGTKAVLNIPSAMGYGAQGAGKDISPNSDLVFEVRLLKVL
jgi:FK506-binding nuclear protein